MFYIIIGIIEIICIVVAFHYHKEYLKQGKKKSWASKEYRIFDFTTLFALFFAPTAILLRRYILHEKMVSLIIAGVLIGLYLALTINSVIYQVKALKTGGNVRK